jgi:CRISPR-associated protein Cmr4
MLANLVYCYLLSPLHTGGATQEGNLLGIARESHTELPYVPSSTVRGKLRSMTEGALRTRLFGPDLEDVKDSDGKLTQGNIWIGDGSVLWLPVPSLSHGVIWVSCPLLLQRWARLVGKTGTLPVPNSFSGGNSKPIYLKDAILKASDLQNWQDWQVWVPESTADIQRVLVLPDQHCTTLIQMSLWRQVKVKLDQEKTVEGGFRYEEAIPPDTLMYFPWGTTAQANGSANLSQQEFDRLLANNNLLQIGGQESLGRGFVQVRQSKGA